jgi:phage baseplate assembly protein W
VTQPVDFGTCWGTPSGSDLSTPSYMATGWMCVAEAVMRRWGTTQGRLVDDPNYGYNLSDLISDDLSPSDLAYAQQQAAAQAELDERVLQATVTLTLSDDGVLSVVAYLVTAAGPFKLVASVSAVGTQLLLVSP